jgi:hypothetical protein
MALYLQGANIDHARAIDVQRRINALWQLADLKHDRLARLGPGGSREQNSPCQSKKKERSFQAGCPRKIAFDFNMIRDTTRMPCGA